MNSAEGVNSAVGGNRAGHAAPAPSAPPPLALAPPPPALPPHRRETGGSSSSSACYAPTPFQGPGSRVQACYAPTPFRRPPGSSAAAGLSACACASACASACAACASAGGGSGAPAATAITPGTHPRDSLGGSRVQGAPAHPRDSLLAAAPTPAAAAPAWELGPGSRVHGSGASSAHRAALRASAGRASQSGAGFVDRGQGPGSADRGHDGATATPLQRPYTTPPQVSGPASQPVGQWVQPASQCVSGSSLNHPPTPSYIYPTSILHLTHIRSSSLARWSSRSS